MELPEAITQFRAILTQKLCQKQERAAFVEVVMILLVGILWGLFNPHQVAQHLGISPKQLYATLNSLSATSWRRLLETMMLEQALAQLRAYAQSSAATKSRRQASLSIDDSVVRRFGKVLSYLWPWYSGQFKHVVRGQDVLGIVLRMGDQIIPLRLVFVSKQGRGPTTKPALLMRELEHLKAYFAGEGIDLTALGVSLDSWWLGQDVSDDLARIGFDKQVIAAKKSLILESRDGRDSLGERKKRAVLKHGWGQPRAAQRLRGENPTLGKVVAIMFDHPRSKTFAVLCPARLLRTCEGLRLWSNHHAVETFWKRLKQWLGLGQMQSRGRRGAWAELCLRVLAYFLALGMFGSDARTLAQVTYWLRRQSTFAELINEHFQLDLCGCS
jgi:AraC-like DNA-binding protein